MSCRLVLEMQFYIVQNAFFTYLYTWFIEEFVQIVELLLADLTVYYNNCVV